MKKLFVMLSLLLAVNANAANVSLGTPFSAGGQTWVPIVGSSLPSDLVSIANINLVFTGTAAAPNDVGHYGNVWPNNWPSLPTCFTTVFTDDIGLGYPEQYVSVGFSNYTCNLSASSGMLGAFSVTGSGTVRLDNVLGSAEDCTEQDVQVVVNESAVSVGGSGGGSGGGGHEEGMTIGEPAAKVVPAKHRTTWGSIKAIYR